jgi:hypothetical protein
VNEDARAHMGVEVGGLALLNGRALHELYTGDSVKVSRGEIVARLTPHQVKVYSTSRKFETARRAGREYTR